MFELLQMWALVEVLGFICLPLTITVFHNLPDRGWAFSKAIGMALLAFGVWLPLVYIHALPFSQGFIAGVLLILLAFNVIGLLRTRHAIVKFVRVNLLYILATEAVFLGMVFLLGWIRSYGPDIHSYEMFMDSGIIAAIMRSPHLPPNDVWFSGYAINYYYYAHFTIATLAKLLGQPAAIAFNTGICIFFGLTAVNLFGVTCNVVAWARHLKGGETAGGHKSPSLLRAMPYGLITILMAQVLGNLAATQQWWHLHGDASQFDWFAPSRVVDKTINEFPAFSFLLSCFHAHVLALAFTVLAVALALNLFLEPEGKGLLIFGRGWRLPLTLGTTALVLGGLFAMNGWDLPTYLGITLICVLLQQWIAHKSRLSLEFLVNLFIVGVNVVVLSFLLYVPFYLNFISPSQGIGIVGPTDHSQLRDEVLIYGMFTFVFLSLLFVSALKRRNNKNVDPPGRRQADATTNQPLAPNDKDVVAGFVPGRFLAKLVPARPAVRIAAVCLLLVIVAELVGAGVWLGGVGALGAAFVAIIRNNATFLLAGIITVLGAVAVLYHLRDRPRAFILLLGTVAFALVAACEVVFLKDVFADNYPRMNTVFKFYFQAWVLLSISSGAGLYFILESFGLATMVASMRHWLQRQDVVLATKQSQRESRLLPVAGVIWAAVLFVFLLAGAVYPLTGTYARTNHYAQRTNSLDGLAYLQGSDPADYAAIRWLNSHVNGDPVIVEAVGPDYSDYAHISALTGLPSPMGWEGHEYQWRFNWLNAGLNAPEFYRRAGDVESIYTDPHPAVVMSLLAHYHAHYLYVGPLEQAKYPTADLQRFSSFMPIVYSAEGVTIYRV